MIKIVVADDEENVRDIVVNFINKVNKGYEVVGRAENGKSALELVESLKPDILISDICMPVMDGLELISEIRHKNIPVKNVIISGYNEFSYAKKAISLGVEEYLLKPFTPGELMDILERLRTDIEKQSILKKNMESMQDEIEKSRQREMQLFIDNVISGNMDEMTLVENEERFNIELLSDMYCVCEVRRCQEKKFDKKMCGILEQLIYNVKSSYFGNRTNAYTASCSQDSLTLLLCGSYRNNLSFQNDIRNGLNKLIESVGKYYDIRLQCTVGTIYYGWSDIKKSFEEAEIVWKGSLDNKQAVTFYDEYAKKQQSFDKDTLQVQLDKYVKELLVQIQMSRKVDAADTVEEIMNCYERYTVDMAGYVSVSIMEMVLSIAAVVKDAGGDYCIWDDKEFVDFLKTHFYTGKLGEIKSTITEYVIRCCKEIERVNEKQSDKIVYAVKNLIEKNISNEDFTLDTISSELYFSIHYIRQVFKQKTDENILEYLIKRRMETAKDLLLDPRELKMVDIAEMTGYKNQRYFATTFKKYYGCTPTEFKEKQQ